MTNGYVKCEHRTWRGISDYDVIFVMMLSFFTFTYQVYVRDLIFSDLTALYVSHLSILSCTTYSICMYTQRGNLIVDKNSLKKETFSRSTPVKLEDDIFLKRVEIGFFFLAKVYSTTFVKEPTSIILHIVIILLNNVCEQWHTFKL